MNRKITPDIQGTLGKAATGINLFRHVVSLLPLVGAAAKGVLLGTASVMSSIDTERQTNMLGNISQLETLGELQQVSEATARQLTMSYRKQLLALRTREEEQLLMTQQRSTTGLMSKAKQAVLNEAIKTAVQDLAEFGVLKILEFLQDGAVKPAIALDKQFVTVIVTPTSKSDKNKTPISHALGLNTVTTSDGQSWCLQNIYHKPGIETIDGHQYSASYTESNLYEYRYGTHEEAHVLGLSLKFSPSTSSSSKESVSQRASSIASEQTADFERELEKTIQSRRVAQLESELEEIRKKQEEDHKIIQQPLPAKESEVKAGRPR